MLKPGLLANQEKLKMSHPYRVDAYLYQSPSQFPSSIRHGLLCLWQPCGSLHKSRRQHDCRIRWIQHVPLAPHSRGKYNLSKTDTTRQRGEIYSNQHDHINIQHKLMGYSYIVKYKRGSQNKAVDALSRIKQYIQALSSSTTLPLRISEVTKSYTNDTKCTL